MERAKNSLEKLNSTLKKKAENDIEFMDDTIFASLKNLRTSHRTLTNLFYETTHELEKERDRIRNINENHILI